MEKKIPTDFTAMGKKIKETLDGRTDNLGLVAVSYTHLPLPPTPYV